MTTETTYEQACERAFENQVPVSYAKVLTELLGERTELLQTGGMTMVGVWTLPGGDILTIGSDVICRFPDIETFWEAPGDMDIPGFDLIDWSDHNNPLEATPFALSEWIQEQLTAGSAT